LKIYFAGGGGGIQEKDFYYKFKIKRLLSFYDKYFDDGNSSRFKYLLFIIQELEQRSFYEVRI